MTPLQEYLRDLERRALIAHEASKAFSGNAFHIRGQKQAGFRDLPFIGIDGEGAGVDEQGRQNYCLFRAGDIELYRDGNPLETDDLLDCILSIPRDVIAVGFYFDYDSTQILRGVPPSFWNRLFRSSAATFYKEYAIDYIPRKHIGVMRLNKGHLDTSSHRIIHDVGGFFQCSFVQALQKWEVGTAEQVELIASEKARRADFTEIGLAEREYCALECQLLAELMEKMRKATYDASISPTAWEGAGNIATALMRREKTPRVKELPESPAEVSAWANRAYFGGRFEITAHGAIDCPVWEYDINSAYPYIMRELPCLKCGKWQVFDALSHSSAVWNANDHRYLAQITYRMPAGSPLGPFPHRNKRSVPLSWPLAGAGIYWDVEIEAARRMGARIDMKRSWHLFRQCEHVPYAWIDDVYQERLAMGKDGPGVVLKLGLNSLYGKTAQRVGQPAYANPIYAGMITAGTRALLLDAIRQMPEDVLMIATDAIYSLRPLQLDLGASLGQWSCTALPDFHIVQPGLYWSSLDGKIKTRGIGKAQLRDRREDFERAWRAYRPGVDEIPEIPIEISLFIGGRLAHARGKPELAGRWLKTQKVISYDWRSKRQLMLHKYHVSDGTVIWCSDPFPGSIRSISADYNGALVDDAELSRYEFEGNPDFLDLRSIVTGA